MIGSQRSEASMHTWKPFLPGQLNSVKGLRPSLAPLTGVCCVITSFNKTRARQHHRIAKTLLSLELNGSDTLGRSTDDKKTVLSCFLTNPSARPRTQYSGQCSGKPTVLTNTKKGFYSRLQKHIQDHSYHNIPPHQPVEWSLVLFESFKRETVG